MPLRDRIERLAPALLGWLGSPSAKPAETPSELGSAEVENRLVAAAVPAVLVASARESSFSKIGGSPDVDSGFVWPTWKGRSLAFLAQLDLAEVGHAHAPAWLPRAGRLWFFYEVEQSTWGFDPNDRGSWRVLFSPTPAAPVEGAATPADVPEHARYRERRVSFRSGRSLPSIERTFPSDAIADDAFERVEELTRRGGEPLHQIGGFPTPVQGDEMELESQLASSGVYVGDATGYDSPHRAALEAGAAEWRLLLQLDSDDDASMMWGDAGRLYFWIRESDARAGRFDDVWMVLQCY